MTSKIEKASGSGDGGKVGALCAAGCGKRIEGGLKYAEYCAQCRAARRRKPVKYPWNAELDAVVREAYNQHAGTKAIAVIQKRTGYPRYTIKSRAAELGAATVRRKEPRWSTAELDILREFAWMVPKRIQMKLASAGFKRTETSIAVQRKRTGARQQVDGMNASQLATMLGIDQKTVTRWIEKGWLRAFRAGTTRDNHDTYFITSGAFRAFVLRHYEYVDLGKAERAGSKLWLLEIISNGAIGGASGTTAALNEDQETEPPPEPALSESAASAQARRALLASVVGEVQAIRRAKGISIKAIAATVGISAGQLEEMLASGRGLSTAVLATIGIALGVEFELRLTPNEKQGARAA